MRNNHGPSIFWIILAILDNIAQKNISKLRGSKRVILSNELILWIILRYKINYSMHWNRNSARSNRSSSIIWVIRVYYLANIEKNFSRCEIKAQSVLLNESLCALRRSENAPFRVSNTFHSCSTIQKYESISCRHNWPN